jgi:ribonuclease BN (tRNA processing enzyme)
VLDIGPFHVTAYEMTHLGPALGYRIEANGAVLAYTGDTGPTPVVDELAKDSDLFIAEATWQDHQDLLPFHLSARQAGQHAASAGAKRLVLTHIWPSLDYEVSRQQAAEEFDGEIIVAEEGMRLDIEPS